MQSYFKDCVFDLCELDGAQPILCEAIEAYVNECQDRGVTIGTWRNETFCRESTCNCVCWWKIDCLNIITSLSLSLSSCVPPQQPL